ncbi:MAG TPA: hypothetical protein VMU04_05625 [Candidatus Acidoferrum sp.]|nr:hypothetical protein [Candidatus Acidoferrum sp.]
MVEIAISLAVIGFALVAIVGILPIGMGLQKQNRQETIINQDGTIFLEAIRNGAQGLDDLTNYIIGITNDVTRFNPNGTPIPPSSQYGYGPYGSSPQVVVTYPLNSGYRIIGLLSTPKYIPITTKSGTSFANGYISNHVVAYVRSMSGPMSEKYPQTNSAMQDLAFSYRLMPEIITYGTSYDPTFNPKAPIGDQQPLNLQGNLHEVRLTFRWPLVDPKGKAGPNQQSFRCMAGGRLLPTNETNYPVDLAHTLYFFQPGNYTTNFP